ncbi:MAG: alanine racemase [Terriglobales bacterium]
MRTTLHDLPTPCLLLERGRMDANLAQLRQRMTKLGVGLRPHLKTAKSIDVAQRMLPTPQGPATVSTLREAEVFAEAGVTDLIYAVGIAPDKLSRVQKLRAQSVDIAVILDSPEQAAACFRAQVPALLELDADGHRAGLRPDDARTLLSLAKQLGPQLRGVLTHAGTSYHAHGVAELEAAAEQERAAVAHVAERLRQAGFACPVVSVGSTPTAHFARALPGVTEVRAGVYVFFDLVMERLGVCRIEDIAISVLATVIGHQAAKGWTLTDAGWMALSRDLGDSSRGYGLVCNLEGKVLPGLEVKECSQEHGVLAMRGDAGTAPPLPVGTRVRILPNHACATAAQHAGYHVLAGGDAVEAYWPRFNGW